MKIIIEILSDLLLNFSDNENDGTCLVNGISVYCHDGDAG